jgi:hypothetical protein
MKLTPIVIGIVGGRQGAGNLHIIPMGDSLKFSKKENYPPIRSL